MPSSASIHNTSGGRQPRPGKTYLAERSAARTRAPFGNGAGATLAAIEHLGYVQIDTIHVIERCHHHILYTRIPEYRREHLHRAQSLDKTVFEYWTHALAYLPTHDMRFYVRDMKNYSSSWFSKVKDQDVRKVLARILQARRAHDPRHRR